MFTKWTQAVLMQISTWFYPCRKPNSFRLKRTLIYTYKLFPSGTLSMS